MPIMGNDKGTGDVIDILSAYGIDLGTDNGQAYEIKSGNEINNESDNGNLTSMLQEINKIPEKSISVKELIMSLHDQEMKNK